MISCAFFMGIFSAVLINDFFFSKSIKCVSRKNNTKLLGKLSSIKSLIKKNDDDEQVKAKYNKSNEQLVFEQFAKNMNKFAKRRQHNLNITI